MAMAQRVNDGVPGGIRSTLNSRLIFWGGAALLVSLFLAFQITTLELRSWDRDEAMKLIAAQAEQSGLRLYRDFFTDSSPLIIASLHAGIELIDDSLLAGRVVVALYGVLALVAVGLAAFEMGGATAGLAAMLLLAVSPGFRSSTQVIWADAPATGLATAAIAAALIERRRGGKGWLVLAGLLMGAALLVKALVVIAVVPLILAVWPSLRESRPRVLLQRFGLLALSGALLPCLALLYYGPAMVQDLLLFTVEAQDKFGVDVAWHLSRAGAYLGMDLGLIVLALTGLVLLRAQFRHVLLLLMWFTVTLFFLVGRAPYWGHQTVSVLPPLAIAGGVAIGHGSAAIRRARSVDRRTSRPARGALAGAVLAGLAAIVWLICLPRAWQSGEIHGYSSTMDPGLQALIDQVQAATSVDDYMVADDWGFAVAARRKGPPELSLMSYKRIAAGYLTSQDMIRNTLKYRVKAVLYGPGRFWGGFPEYEQWLADNFVLQGETASGHRLWLPADWTAAYRDGPAVDFDTYVSLLGWRPPTAALHPGDVLRFDLFWRSRTPAPVDYTVFVHLVDGNGRQVAGGDAQPLDGIYPTGQWQPGQELRDPRQLPLPADLPPGEYAVDIGLYDLKTGARLPARNAAGEELKDGTLRLGVIRVMP